MVSAGNLHARVPVERIDGEDRPAALALHRLGEITVDHARQGRVVQRAGPGHVLAEVEHVLREALNRVVEPASDVHVREGRGPVLQDRLRVERDLLVAEHVGERDLRVAVQVAAARHAQRHRRSAGQGHLLEGALAAHVVAQERVAERGREIEDRSRSAEVLGGDEGQLGVARDRVHAVAAFVVVHERDAHSGFLTEDDRREIAGGRVRHLAQLVRGEVERPDVRNGAVARHGNRQRHARIRRRRREDDRAIVHELGVGVVVAAERELPFGAGGEHQLEQLVVRADARRVDEGRAIG